MNNEAEIMKLEALSYWRLERQHIIGAIECQNADVKTLTRHNMITETEVKTNIRDMRREMKTKLFKHKRMGGGEQLKLNRPPWGQYLPPRPYVHYFYFLVPERLKEKAAAVCEELYPYAGLLVWNGKVADLYGDTCIYSVRKAKRLDRKPASVSEITRLGYGAANTALRYGNKFLDSLLKHSMENIGSK